MINTQEIINTLTTTIDRIEAISTTGGTDVDIGLEITKVAANLANVSASATPYVPTLPTSSPLDILAPIKNIMGDLGQGDQYFDRIENFIRNAQDVKTEKDLINLVLQEVVDPNWSFQIDINGDGKSVSLVNGTEIINLGKSLLSGNTLDAHTAILGIATKFEKEIFGFSIIETVKELDELSKVLSMPNPADIKIDSVLNMLDGLLVKMGGPRLSPMIKGLIALVTNLNKKRMEAKKILEDAIKEFEEKKVELLTGETPPPDEEETTTTTEEPTTTEAPEETTTTTLAPSVPEEPELAPPPPPAPPEEAPGETQDEKELISSVMEFEDDIGEEDEDYF